MKIVHVLPTLVKGGAERVVVDLANHAAAAGHQVSVLASHKVDETLLRNDLRPDVEVRYVAEEPGPIAWRYGRTIPWLAANRKWLLAHDVIHCHLTFGAALGSLAKLVRGLRGRGRRPALVESYQAVGAPINPVKRWVHGRLGLSRDAFVIMADDGYWGRFLARHPKLHSRIIPNGIAVPAWGDISSEERDRYRREVGIPDDCRWIVSTVGRVVAERRPWMYLPIFRKIADALGPQVHFIYAGGGPVEDQLRAKAAELGLEKQVHITGLVRNPALPLSVTDVYITYNVGPVAGIATLEAVFRGLPVVAVQGRDDYDGAKDWIRSGTDSDVLAKDVIALLQSAQARSERASAQHDHAWKHLRVEAMAAAYDEVYAQAIAIANRH